MLLGAFDPGVAEGIVRLAWPTRPPATLEPLELPWPSGLFKAPEVLCIPELLVALELLVPVELVDPLVFELLVPLELVLLELGLLELLRPLVPLELIGL